MKILHVVPSYLPATRYGGPIYSVHGLCKALAQRGHEVHVFTTNVDGAGDSDVPLGQAVELDGVQVWYFPSRRLRRLFYAPLMKKDLSDRIRSFDLVHLHSVFLWPTLAAAQAARAAGTPYVLAPRGMLNRDLIQRKSTLAKNAWIRLFEAANVERAAALHLTSEVECRELARLDLKMPPVVVVPNGIDLPGDLQQAVHSTADSLPNASYALFLGRVNWKKGLDRLLRAWKFVPETELLIAGNDEEGYQPELARLARQLGIAGRVRFLGAVAGAEKWRLFHQASLFVLASQSENFGVAVLEAMAAGCPVAVTPGVGLAEKVAEQRCGIVIDGTPEEMGAALSDLLSDDAQRRDMGIRGQAAAREQFSWQAIAREMEQVYQGILERGSKTAEVCAP